MDSSPTMVLAHLNSWSRECKTERKRTKGTANWARFCSHLGTFFHPFPCGGPLQSSLIIFGWSFTITSANTFTWTLSLVMLHWRGVGRLIFGLCASVKSDFEKHPDLLRFTSARIESAKRRAFWYAAHTERVKRKNIQLTVVSIENSF